MSKWIPKPGDKVSADGGITGIVSSINVDTETAEVVISVITSMTFGWLDLTLVNSKKEMVKSPSHYYPGDHELRKVLDTWELDKVTEYWQAVKYIVRAGKKNPDTEIEDIEKAINNLQYKVDKLKGERDG